MKENLSPADRIHTDYDCEIIKNSKKKLSGYKIFTKAISPPLKSLSKSKGNSKLGSRSNLLKGSKKYWFYISFMILDQLSQIQYNSLQGTFDFKIDNDDFQDNIQIQSFLKRFSSFSNSLSILYFLVSGWNHVIYELTWNKVSLEAKSKDVPSPEVKHCPYFAAVLQMILEECPKSNREQAYEHRSVC